MSSVNYSLKHKGVKLIPSEKAWIKGKNGKPKLNPKYAFVGKIDTKTPKIVRTRIINQQWLLGECCTQCCTSHREARVI